MKRFAAHYIFIYPGLLFRNGIVEIEQEKVRLLPFHGEIAYTSWVSGMVVLLPDQVHPEHLGLMINNSEKVIVTEPYVLETIIPILPFRLFPVEMETLSFPDDARLIPLF